MQYSCQVCEKEFFSENSLNQHKDAKDHWHFNCEFCDKQCTTKNGLEAHKKAKHSSEMNQNSNQGQKVRCLFCKVRNNTKSDCKNESCLNFENNFSWMSKQFLKDDETEWIEFKIAANKENRRNVECFFDQYERVCEQKNNLQDELDEKNQQIISLNQQIQNLKKAMPKTKKLQKEISEKIALHLEDFDERNGETKEQLDTLTQKFESLLTMVKTFVQDDDQGKIKRALEKSRSFGSHLYMNYEEKLFDLSKVIKLSQQYLKESKDLEAQEECCCICFEEFTVHNPRSPQNCGHNLFHTNCIQKWKETSNTCPLCKQNF